MACSGAASSQLGPAWVADAIPPRLADADGARATIDTTNVHAAGVDRAAQPCATLGTTWPTPAFARVYTGSIRRAHTGVLVRQAPRQRAPSAAGASPTGYRHLPAGGRHATSWPRPRPRTGGA